MVYSRVSLSWHFFCLHFPPNIHHLIRLGLPVVERLVEDGGLGQDGSDGFSTADLEMSVKVSLDDCGFLQSWKSA